MMTMLQPRGTEDLAVVEDEMMTRQEVADFLKVSLRTADSFIHNGKFDGLLYIGKSVRVSKNKLMKYIQNNLQFKK